MSSGIAASFASSNPIFLDFNSALVDRLHSTAQKVKKFATSPAGQLLIGFGLGLGINHVMRKIVRTSKDPLSDLNLDDKLLLTPFVCLIGPIVEEIRFRGDLQSGLKNYFDAFYINRGFSQPVADTASRITAIFFSSLIFGLIHFGNALIFWCNPMLVLPQVISATIGGILLGLAKEFTGELFMPIGIHIGNNTLAWMINIASSL